MKYAPWRRTSFDVKADVTLNILGFPISTEIVGESMLRQSPWLLRPVGGLDGKSPVAPCIEAALERSDSVNPVSPKDQRRPGARGLVGSRAVENNLLVPRNFVVTLL